MYMQVYVKPVMTHLQLTIAAALESALVKWLGVAGRYYEQLKSSHFPSTPFSNATFSHFAEGTKSNTLQEPIIFIIKKTALCSGKVGPGVTS
jgi:hypothetical protein